MNNYKLSKSDLKSVVKECLLEILSEGIGDRSAVVENRRRDTPVRRQEMVQKQPRQPTPSLRDAVRREAGGNRVMESILADTAASTLPRMLEGDSKRLSSAPASGGIAERVVAAASPEQIFGDDTTSKWADLAFMGTSLPKK